MHKQANEALQCAANYGAHFVQLVFCTSEVNTNLQVLTDVFLMTRLLDR